MRVNISQKHKKVTKQQKSCYVNKNHVVKVTHARVAKEVQQTNK